MVGTTTLNLAKLLGRMMKSTRLKSDDVILTLSQATPKVDDEVSRRPNCRKSNGAFVCKKSKASVKTLDQAELLGAGIAPGWT